MKCHQQVHFNFLWFHVMEPHVSNDFSENLKKELFGQLYDMFWSVIINDIWMSSHWINCLTKTSNFLIELAIWSTKMCIQCKLHFIGFTYCSPGFPYNNLIYTMQHLKIKSRAITASSASPFINQLSKLIFLIRSFITAILWQ